MGTHMIYNPIKLSEIVEKNVVYLSNGKIFRKYYRFRATKFYGGSSTGDIVGCNLSCKYCWSLGTNTSPAIKGIGFYVDPEEAALRLLSIASQKSFKYIRLSGGEPTIGFDHILQLLKNISKSALFDKIRFILETNGILIGYKKNYAGELSKFPFVTVRVSLKGCSPNEFNAITGAGEEFYDYQLKAIKYLFENNVDTIVAITISFCNKDSFSRLVQQLLELGEDIIDRIELEVVKLYPSIAKRLCKSKIYPWIAIDPRKNVLLRGEAIERILREGCRGNVDKDPSRSQGRLNI
ncbi:MAG: radical SAM protein [Ignisphaera sp.]|uniref:Radical SAM protein n=1 Tax=Ignisphaera aggregans TaxID=334771 RepID=A0A7J3JSY4_9CREN